MNIKQIIGLGAFSLLVSCTDVSKDAPKPADLKTVTAPTAALNNATPTIPATASPGVAATVSATVAPTQDASKMPEWPEEGFNNNWHHHRGNRFRKFFERFNFWRDEKLTLHQLKHEVERIGCKRVVGIFESQPKEAQEKQHKIYQEEYEKFKNIQSMPESDAKVEDLKKFKLEHPEFERAHCVIRHYTHQQWDEEWSKLSKDEQQKIITEYHEHKTEYDSLKDKIRIQQEEIERNMMKNFNESYKDFHKWRHWVKKSATLDIEKKFEEKRLALEKEEEALKERITQDTEENNYDDKQFAQKKLECDQKREKRLDTKLQKIKQSKSLKQEPTKQAAEKKEEGEKKDAEKKVEGDKKEAEAKIEK